MPPPCSAGDEQERSRRGAREDLFTCCSCCLPWCFGTVQAQAVRGSRRPRAGRRSATALVHGACLQHSCAVWQGHFHPASTAAPSAQRAWRRPCSVPCSAAVPCSVSRNGRARWRRRRRRRRGRRPWLTRAAGWARRRRVWPPPAQPAAPAALPARPGLQPFGALRARRWPSRGGERAGARSPRQRRPAARPQRHPAGER